MNRIRKLAVAALCLLLVTGCWSRRELNELLIVLGVGIDWVDDQYLVSFQVVNPSEISAQKRGGERPPVTLYQGRGHTVFEAARALTAEAPRKVYMGHLQIYVMSEAAARRGVRKIIDHSLRDNELRLDFDLIVAKNASAADILQIYTPLDKLPSNNMLRSLQTSEKSWAPTVSVTLDEALDRLSGPGHELVLTGIERLGPAAQAKSKKNVETFLPGSRFRYTGIAAFKEGRLTGWLSEKESKGFTDVTNKLKSTSIDLPCDGDTRLGLEVTSSKASIRTKMEDGMPKGLVRIRTEANIVDRPCGRVDLNDPATIKQLEKQAAAVMEKNAMAAIARAKELKTDIFGFGEQLGKSDPRAWNRVKESWSDAYFPHIEVAYKIELFIRKTGTTGNTTLQ